MYSCAVSGGHNRNTHWARASDVFAPLAAPGKSIAALSAGARIIQPPRLSALAIVIAKVGPREIPHDESPARRHNFPSRSLSRSTPRKANLLHHVRQPTAKSPNHARASRISCRTPLMRSGCANRDEISSPASCASDNSFAPTSRAVSRFIGMHQLESMSISRL